MQYFLEVVQHMVVNNTVHVMLLIGCERSAIGDCNVCQVSQKPAFEPVLCKCSHPRKRYCKRVWDQIKAKCVVVAA